MSASLLQIRAFAQELPHAAAVLLRSTTERSKLLSVEIVFAVSCEEPVKVLLGT